MTDIADGLRAPLFECYLYGDLLDLVNKQRADGADEIERLRKALSFFFEMNDNEVGLKYTHIEAQRLAVAELTREKSDD